MKTFAATVLGRRRLSTHLVRISLEVEGDLASTGTPDEYLRVLIPPAGTELVLPTIDASYTVTFPAGTIEPAARVYTISDLRVTAGRRELDLDIALHGRGIGSDWARDCEPGDRIGLVEPHGQYAAAADVAEQLVVADITGLPALARILRGLGAGQRARAVVVLTDDGDRIALPSPGDVEISWIVVDGESLISEALSGAVLTAELPSSPKRYVWLAGEARASRAVRAYLRRELGWPQSDFATCGYWQLDAERWSARYAQMAEQINAEAAEAQRAHPGDEGAYLDALDDIYDRAGL